MMGAMCGVQRKDRNRSKYLMLSFNEAMYRLAMAYSVCWYDHVLGREDGHGLKGHWILRLKVKGRNGC